MARFTVQVAEVHYTSYIVEADSAQEAQNEVFNKGEMLDNSTEFSHLLGSDHKVYDENDQLVLD